MRRPAVALSFLVLFGCSSDDDDASSNGSGGAASGGAGASAGAAAAPSGGASSGSGGNSDGGAGGSPSAGGSNGGGSGSGGDAASGNAGSSGVGATGGSSGSSGSAGDGGSAGTGTGGCDLSVTRSFPGDNPISEGDLCDDLFVCVADTATLEATLPVFSCDEPNAFNCPTGTSACAYRNPGGPSTLDADELATMCEATTLLSGNEEVVCMVYL